MDRFQKELHDCSKLAHDAKQKDDREFWQQAAQRWKSLLEHYEERPAFEREQPPRQVTRFNRRHRLID